jgi:hypothetical protein
MSRSLTISAGWTYCCRGSSATAAAAAQQERMIQEVLLCHKCLSQIKAQGAAAADQWLQQRP